MALAVILPYFSLLAENPPYKENKVVTGKGVIVKGMPKVNLENAGFTEELLVSKNILDNQQYLTFQDISTARAGDNITFYIEDGKIVDWFRGIDLGVLEANITR